MLRIHMVDGRVPVVGGGALPCIRYTMYMYVQCQRVCSLSLLQSKPY